MISYFNLETMSNMLLILTIINAVLPLICIPILIWLAYQIDHEGQSNSLVVVGVVVNLAYLVASTVYLINGNFLDDHLSQVYRVIHVLMCLFPVLHGLDKLRMAQQIETPAPEKQSLIELCTVIRAHKKGA